MALRPFEELHRRNQPLQTSLKNIKLERGFFHRCPHPRPRLLPSIGPVPPDAPVVPLVPHYALLYLIMDLMNVHKSHALLLVPHERRLPQTNSACFVYRCTCKLHHLLTCLHECAQLEHHRPSSSTPSSRD